MIRQMVQRKIGQQSAYAASVAALLLGSLISLVPAHMAFAASGLGSGQTLGAGGQITSPDGHYTLIMQSDGNLVDYALPRPVWASGTNGHAGSDLEMQGDGNLVVYAPGHVAIWASGTSGHPGANLQLQNDANMVIRDTSGSVLWASGAVDVRLDAGQRLNPGWQFQSPDRNYRMVMQGDGNLVVYHGGTALWASNTNKVGSDLEMQSDGNLVVYAPGHIAVWASGTFTANSALVGQNDGNFVIYAPGSRAVWATNTNPVTPAVPSQPSTLTSCPTMQQGSAGSCVAMLQQYLNAAGAGPGLTVDGVFGPLTRQAVVNYQSSRGLSADGIAGPQTLQALAAHKPPVSAPVSHKYPASFNPVAAANWATANALKSIPVPTQTPFQSGDAPCTTFVSWALEQGGMPEDADWFPYFNDPSPQHGVYLYISSNNPAPAWYATDNFRARFDQLGWTADRQIYPGTNPAAISVGDVIYYQWQGVPGHATHLAIVTKVSNGQIYVTDQGGVTLYPQSINRPLYFGHAGDDLRTEFPSMKVYVLHWQ